MTDAEQLATMQTDGCALKEARAEQGGQALSTRSKSLQWGRLISDRGWLMAEESDAVASLQGSCHRSEL